MVRAVSSYLVRLREQGRGGCSNSADCLAHPARRQGSWRACLLYRKLEAKCQALLSHLMATVLDKRLDWMDPETKPLGTGKS